MEEDILNYLYQLSCFVGHPVVHTVRGVHRLLERLNHYLIYLHTELSVLESR